MGRKLHLAAFCLALSGCVVDSPRCRPGTIYLYCEEGKSRGKDTGTEEDQAKNAPRTESETVAESQMR